MKKTVKVLSVIFFSFLFVSCSLFHLRSKPKEFAYLYDARNTGLGNSIKIDGYYMARDNNTNHLYVDENDGRNYIVFYRDGLICFPYSTPEKAYGNKSANSISNRTMWGVYVYKRDNVFKSQTILDMGAMSNPWIENKYFEVIDSTKIRLIGSQIEGSKYITRNIIYDYYPLFDRMDSTNCWLLKKKWFWTEEAWNKRSNK